MIGQDSFRTLEGVEVISNPNYPDEPWYSTGGLAIVFKLKLKDKLYALKCFYTKANERQERLGLIAAYLKQNPSPYFVDFTYLEDELWVGTDNDEGQGYPVVLMEWVEGKTLDNYLEQICTQNNTPALKNFYFQFCNLAWWLQQQPIAHGDIKHDNLIVTPDGKLKLIDYDGVFVPALRGRKANEMGSPCYQHPKRDAYFFDKNLDDFSLLVLQITLLALQHNPKLFAEHYNCDGIILKDTDYHNFAQSSIKSILWQLPEVKIPLLLSQLQGNLNNLSAIDLMPLLQDVALNKCMIDRQKVELVDKHSLFSKGCTNFINNNFKYAIENFNCFIEIVPSYAPAYCKRAEAKYKLEDFVGSIKDFSKAIDINPNFKKAYVEMGKAKYFIKDDLGAIDDFSRAIEIKSEMWSNLNILFLRGRSKMRLKDYLGAIDDFTKAIEINRKSSNTYHYRGLSKIEVKDYIGALDDFTKVIEINPKHSIAYYSRGISKRRLKDYMGAIDDFTKAIEIDPKYSIAYTWRGMIKEVHENYSGAIHDYLRAIELNENYKYFYEYIGDCYSSLNNHKKSIEYYLLFLNFEPNSISALNSISIQYEEIGELWDADKYISKAFELAPNDELIKENFHRMTLPF